MFIEWDKLAKILVKACDILPPMFKSLYLCCSRSIVCYIGQFDARFSITSPLIKKNIWTYSSGRPECSYFLYKSMQESNKDSQIY
jgi:hypothetical protein